MTTSALGRSAPSTSDSATSSSDIVRQVAVVFAYISTIVVNALANLVPIGGLTTGELSDQFDVFFVPAGYVFSIWSLIYLGLGAYVVYQAIPAQRDHSRLRSIGWLFVLSCVFNSGWIFLWHYQLVGLSILVMLGILATLIAIYARLYPSYSVASWAEKIMTHWSFRIYLGWITVATIANATTFLDSIGYGGAPLTPRAVGRRAAGRRHGHRPLLRPAPARCGVYGGARLGLCWHLRQISGHARCRLHRAGDGRAAGRGHCGSGGALVWQPFTNRCDLRRGKVEPQ